MGDLVSSRLCCYFYQLLITVLLPRRLSAPIYCYDKNLSLLPIATDGGDQPGAVSSALVFCNSAVGVDLAVGQLHNLVK